MTKPVLGCDASLWTINLTVPVVMTLRAENESEALIEALRHGFKVTGVFSDDPESHETWCTGIPEVVGVKECETK